MLTMVHSNKAYGRTEHSCIPMYPINVYKGIGRNNKISFSGVDLDSRDDGRSRRSNPVNVFGIDFKDTCRIVSGSAFTWPTGDFGLGIWAHFTGFDESRTFYNIFSWGLDSTSESNYVRIMIRSDTGVQNFIIQDSDGDIVINIATSGQTWTPNTYYYFQVIKKGNTWTMKRDSSEWSETYSGNMPTATGYLWVGNARRTNFDRGWRGHIEDFVVTTHSDSFNDKGDPRPYR